MPRLRYAGRYWSVSSDDFVLPALCDVAARLGLAAALGVVGFYVFTHRDYPGGCTFDLRQMYVYVTEAVVALGVMGDTCLACVSASGTLSDTRPRRRVNRALTLSMLLALAEVACAGEGLYAMFLTTRHCLPHFSHGGHGIALPEHLQLILRATVVAHCTLFGLRLCGFYMAFDHLGKTSAEERLQHTADAVAQRREGFARSFRRCMWCCTTPGDSGAFDEMGDLMVRALEGAHRLDLTVSDITAGLALVRLAQKDEEAANVQARVRQAHMVSVRGGPAAAESTLRSVVGSDGASEAGRGGGAAVSAGGSSVHSGGGGVSRHQQPTRSPVDAAARSLRKAASSKSFKLHDHGTTGGVALGFSAADTNVLAEASHYAEFAIGAYGWMLFLWSRLACGVCTVARGCVTAACANCGGNASVAGDCCTLNQTSLELETGIRREDVLVADYSNRGVGQPAFAVIRDNRRRAVVIAVRGTLSFNDVLTDALVAGTNVRDDADCDYGRGLGLPEGAAYVHRGMWTAAKRIKRDIDASGVIAELASSTASAPGHPGSADEEIDSSGEGGRARGRAHAARQPLLAASAHGSASSQPRLGKRLVIVGHSLGAGVATLLTLLYQAEVPSVRCWAFSPPGSIVSPPLAALLDKHIVSVVLGKDMFPRLSLPAFRRLTREMIQRLKHARVSKWTLLRRGFCCGKPATAEQAFYAYSPDTDRTEVIRRLEASLATGGALSADHNGGVGGGGIAHRGAAMAAAGVGAGASAPATAAPSGLDTSVDIDIDGLGPDSRKFDLHLAGRVLHLVKVATHKGCVRSTRIFEPMWAPRQEFTTLRVSTLMLADHMPNRVLETLRVCAAQRVRGDSLPRDAAAALGGVVAQ